MGATIHPAPGEQPISERVVLVDAAAIPAQELDVQLEEAFTRFGFTSVFDTASAWENTRRIRARTESGEVAGPTSAPPDPA